MRYQIDSFEELDTQTLYEILSHRFEVFVLEQRCIYHDFDPRCADLRHGLSGKVPYRPGICAPVGCI